MLQLNARASRLLVALPMLVALTLPTACSTMQRQAALECGLIGGALGALLGKGKKAIAAGAGISAAVCWAIAADMDNRRKNALARERALDEQIATEARGNAELAAENRRLAAQLEDLRRIRRHLETTRDDGSEQRARLRAQLVTDAQSARERLEIVDERIRYVDEALRNPKLDFSRRAALQQLRANLVDRRSILSQMAALV